MGERQEMSVCFIRVGDLGRDTVISKVRQAYTRLDDHGAYRYEGLTTGFDGLLHVDANGFVTDYPGLFTRL